MSTATKFSRSEYIFEGTPKVCEEELIPAPRRGADGFGGGIPVVAATPSAFA